MPDLQIVIRHSLTIPRSDADAVAAVIARLLTTFGYRGRSTSPLLTSYAEAVNAMTALGVAHDITVSVETAPQPVSAPAE